MLLPKATLFSSDYQVGRGRDIKEEKGLSLSESTHINLEFQSITKALFTRDDESFVQRLQDSSFKDESIKRL